MIDLLNSRNRRTIKVYQLLGYNQGKLDELERASSGCFGSLIEGDRSNLSLVSTVQDASGLRDFILVGGDNYRRVIRDLEDNGFDIGHKIKTVRNVGDLKELQEMLNSSRIPTGSMQDLLKRAIIFILGASFLGALAYDEIYNKIERNISPEDNIRRYELISPMIRDSLYADSGSDSFVFIPIEQRLKDQDTLYNFDD